MGRRFSAILNQLEELRTQNGTSFEESIAKLSADEQNARRESFQSTAEAGLRAGCVLLINQLKQAHGRLPVETIREIRTYRELMIPDLIGQIDRATHEVEHGIDLSCNPLIALFLLAEFKADAAFPVILKALALPDEQPFELFGEAITESMSSILTATVGQAFDQLDAFILCGKTNLYARQQAVYVYLQQVRAGLMTRDVVVQRLLEFLQHARAHRDSALATAAVISLRKLAPREALQEIKAAYIADLVDDSYVTFAAIEAASHWDQASMEEALNRGLPTEVTDCIAVLSSWQCFQSPSSPSKSPSGILISDPHWFPNQSRRASSVSAAVSPDYRARRNDRCPCGSGQKYKKCCGR
jgi:Protein of unknown function (DUF1186)/SEC-C motif